MMKNITKLLLIGLILCVLLVAGATAGIKSKTVGWLGVYTTTIDQEMIEDMNLDLPDDQGAIVTDIVDDSPADEAGLRENDVIFEINGKSVNSSGELRDLVGEFHEGDEVTIKIMRKGREKEIEITLDERPSQKKTFFGWNKSRYDHDDDHDFDFDFDFDFSDEHGSGYIGVSIISLSDQLADYFGASKGGVLITEVHEDSPAEKAGLEAGDVIVRINGDRVDSPSDVSELIGEMDEGDQAEIILIRDKDDKEIEVEVGEREGSFYGSDFNIIIPNQSLKRIDRQKIERLKDIARIKSLDFRGRHDIDIHDMDLDDYKSDMDDLRKELRELQRELKELRENLR